MFCPFRSTAEKEVECSERCALYMHEESEAHCRINQIGDKVETLDGRLCDVNESVGSAASALWNKM